MKMVLATLFTLMAILSQAQETNKLKAPGKHFSFELEYTPLSDVQPVFLIRTRKGNQWGIKILSSSLFFLYYEQTEDIFEEKNFWGFQTTILGGFGRENLFEWSYSSHNDIVNVFYRKQIQHRFVQRIETGIFLNYANPVDISYQVLHYGMEFSCFHRLTRNISIGNSIQIGPYSFSKEFIWHYGGIAINYSYFVVSFNLY